MRTMQGHTRTRTQPLRRLALDLLAALALTLGAVAAPLLAGTAHANRGAGTGVECCAPSGGVGTTGTAPRPTTGQPGGGQPAGTVSPAGGSKPGGAVGSN